MDGRSDPGRMIYPKGKAWAVEQGRGLQTRACRPLTPDTVCEHLVTEYGWQHSFFDPMVTAHEVAYAVGSRPTSGEGLLSGS